MIRHTHATQSGGTVVAYADNAAVMEGAVVRRFYPGAGRALYRARRAHAHPDEGRDAQPSDRDRAVSGRGDRIGRRDSRRRRDRQRREAEGGAHRIHGVAPAHADVAAAVGRAVRQARPHRVRAGDHARRPDRRRGVQQRIRPAESARLLPHVRAGSRRRGARLPQADHDRRRPRQSARGPRREAADPRGRAARFSSAVPAC